MDLLSIPFSDLFTWVIVPLFIVLARIVDVSIGTLRIIFVSRGYRFLAPVLGFFEVIIWLLAIGEIMKNLNNPVCYIAYGLGFALGNYLGILLEDRLSIGQVIVRVITKRDAGQLVESFKQKNYGVTSINAEGSTGEVKLIFLIINRSNLTDVVDQIKHFNPTAFYSIEDVRSVQEGVFPLNKPGFLSSKLNAMKVRRKQK
ncbi:MAG: DUF2179 domain-containing protein [Methanocalculus sp.]|uniref:DUF2179 domain-containing protein n=1 Tax=Methanocalculus sp. TaxID=2004547 RepID=UPI00271688AD|nr:DUF2179 domain-containing protein [Methanocalculus sp.]MDO8841109.1 DUF2179 domain-containing protein [Methanocalculus sp.]MDO9539356.1 DUF2179 domain-containing protein [Methanocalculus sp.]